MLSVPSPADLTRGLSRSPSCFVPVVQLVVEAHHLVPFFVPGSGDDKVNSELTVFDKTLDACVRVPFPHSGWRVSSGERNVL